MEHFFKTMTIKSWHQQYNRVNIQCLSKALICFFLCFQREVVFPWTNIVPCDFTSGAANRQGIAKNKHLQQHITKIENFLKTSNRVTYNNCKCANLTPPLSFNKFNILCPFSAVHFGNTKFTKKLFHRANACAMITQVGL